MRSAALSDLAVEEPERCCRVGITAQRGSSAAGATPDDVGLMCVSLNVPALPGDGLKALREAALSGGIEGTVQDRAFVARLHHVGLNDWEILLRP